MIYVVGLGPGDPALLTLAAWDVLRGAERVVLRTAHTEVAAFLTASGIRFDTYDYLYEVHTAFDDVYRAIADDLLERAKQGRRVVYAVPGHPGVAERSVDLLLEAATGQGIVVEVVPGLSSLEAVYASLHIDPAQGMAVVDALDEDMVIEPRLGLVVTQVYSRLVAGDLKLRLLKIYPAEHEVAVVSHAGTKQALTLTMPLAELDHREFGYADTVYIPPCLDAKHAGVELEKLRLIMARLRAPHGCPWDQEQTHHTLKPYLVEESYEVLEAIDEGSADKLAEELGDLLLQVVFHAAIAEEQGEFVLADAIRLINEKLVRRHPHVFGDVSVKNALEVVDNWQKIKQDEKAEAAWQSVLASVPKHLPALQQAYKVQDRAKRVGFDWPSIEGAIAKLEEELSELNTARQSGVQAFVQDELGDVLFSVVNVSRFLGVEPENALREAIHKFRRRFALVEKLALQRGIVLHECNLEELDKLWDEIKQVDS